MEKENRRPQTKKIQNKKTEKQGRNGKDISRKIIQ